MKKNEEIRLRKLYNEMPEQQLIDMLSEDEKDFQDGVYALLVEEVRRRGLEEKIDEMKKNKIEKESKMPEETDLVTVYAGSLLEVQLLKSLLEANEISAFLKDEILGTQAPPYAAPGGVGAIKVVIAKRDLDRAKPIVQEFLKEKQSEYKFLKVYSTSNQGEIVFIKSILDSQKIPYYIQGEHFGTLYGPLLGKFSMMDVMVREDYTQEAKELLKDFIKPQ